jgi:hypothetical protein
MDYASLAMYSRALASNENSAESYRHQLSLTKN